LTASSHRKTGSFEEFAGGLLNVTAFFPPDKKEPTENIKTPKAAGLHDTEPAAFVFEELK
jgi:hypothetical protein